MAQTVAQAGAVRPKKIFMFGSATRPPFCTAAMLARY